MTGTVVLPLSFGEAADKIAILQIKRERIADPDKLAHVEAELRAIAPIFFASVGEAAGFEALFARLKEINGRLWEIEEGLRQHERKGAFGVPFIELARAVYRTNDERFRLKREIDRLLGSEIFEEKSYVE